MRAPHAHAHPPASAGAEQPAITQPGTGQPGAAQPGDGRPRLVLASASPARRKLLAAAGIDADVLVSGVDESTVTDTDPATVAGTLARMKAEAVAARLAAQGQPHRQGQPHGQEQLGGPTFVLGCDSVLGMDGEVLGKPADVQDAARRWHAMRGRSGVLYTGHCLVDTATATASTEVAATTVHFAEITERELTAYLASGEPLQVAGAFTIDGLGGPFVERIEGDAGTVVGLSLPLLRRLVAQRGFAITDFWRS